LKAANQSKVFCIAAQYAKSIRKISGFVSPRKKSAGKKWRETVEGKNKRMLKMNVCGFGRKSWEREGLRLPEV
jgi:hypothetical protein